MRRGAVKKFVTCLLFACGLSSALGQAPFTILEYTSEWKYLQGITTPSNWFGIDYDDTTWPEGRGIFAVPTNENVLGVAPVNTALSTNVGDGFIITYYFRTSLSLRSNPSNAVISGSAAIDDGAVIYVNGREARRIGMPNGVIQSNTFANRAIEISADGLDSFNLASSNFVQGVNVVAVEVRQSAANSVDAVFGMRLIAQPLQAVSIVTQPADQTVEVGKNATFSVHAEGSALSYQWFANGVRMNGATNSSLTTAPVTLSMNGWTYHVVVSNAISSVTSEAATLTVVPDETGPVAQYAVVTGPAQIEIQFNERILIGPATNIANYSLLLLGTTNRLIITNAQWTFNRVRLRGPAVLNPLSNYVVCIANVADFYTNAIVPNPMCIGVGFPETNRVVSLGALWRYNDNATNTLPDAWKTLNYDDDPFAPPYHWAEGYGAFGYSFSPNYFPCSPIMTLLSGGATTYYFRKRFVLTEDYPADAVMRLRYEADDGAIVYINGAEIYRTTNMPAGTVTYFTQAGHVSTAACVTVGIPVSENLLARGMNLLAVEVHQAIEPQQHLVDVIFDAELSLEYRRPPIVPELHVAYTASGVMLTWEGNGWSLQVAENVFGPWSRLSTSNNRYVRPLDMPGERRFYRLVNP